MTFNSFSEFPRSSRSQRRIDPRLESPGQLALVAVVVWLAAALIHPLSVLLPLALVLLALAAAAYLLRPRSRSMYWRGRRIDLDDRPSPAEHVYHLFFKR